MTPKKYKEDLRGFDENIDNCELNLKHCSNEKEKKSYQDLKWTPSQGQFFS